MTKKISLDVNGVPINLDYFVESFVHHTTRGMVESLEGTDPTEDIQLEIDDGLVQLELGGKPVATNRFVNIIVTSTVSGMVSPLKGVTEPVKKVKIEIQG